MTSIYGLYFMVYIAISAFLSFYIVGSVKSKRFIADFIIVFWIMTFQIYTSAIALYEVPKLGMLRGSYQVVAAMLAILFLLEFLSNDKQKVKTNLLSYEKYLYAYFFMSIFLIRLHGYLGSLAPKMTYFWTKLYITGILFYYLLTKVITRETIEAITKAIITLGILTSLVSLYQFFADSQFMRLSSFYDAFGRYDRASGVFSWPYDNGLILILAIFVVNFTIRNFRVKYILIIFFIFNLALVFTRGVWLSFLGVVVIHGYLYHKKQMKRMIVLVPLILIGSYFLLSMYIFGFQLLSGAAWEERVFADTVTVRLMLYKFVIETIPDKWLIGYGDYKNNIVYFKGMVNSNHELAWALGKRGGIHNVILQELFVRGIFPPFFLIVFFVKFFKYNFRESIKKNTYFYCIASYFALSFFLYVFSVGEYLQSRSGYLTIVFFAMISAIHHKNIDISGITLGYIYDNKSEEQIIETDNSFNKGSDKVGSVSADSLIN